jgi:hypothetical protein
MPPADIFGIRFFAAPPCKFWYHLSHKGDKHGYRHRNTGTCREKVAKGQWLLTPSPTPHEAVTSNQYQEKLLDTHRYLATAH